LQAPFGGLKQSGLGRELGMQAMEQYSETRNIYFETE
jgi:acyl-CoA reductase-like NAD-dependent aldehyde dehydrogenase